MKKFAISVSILIVWGATLWIVFWLGFLKSQMIATHVQHLEDLRNLSDQKILISDIREGRISKAENDLGQRIALGDSIKDMKDESSYGFLDVVRYAIYPREAFSLINVSESSRRHKQDK